MCNMISWNEGNVHIKQYLCNQLLTPLQFICSPIFLELSFFSNCKRNSAFSDLFRSISSNILRIWVIRDLFIVFNEILLMSVPCIFGPTSQNSKVAIIGFWFRKCFRFITLPSASPFMTLPNDLNCENIEVPSKDLAGAFGGLFDKIITQTPPKMKNDHLNYSFDNFLLIFLQKDSQGLNFIPLIFHWMFDKHETFCLIIRRI